MSEQSTGPEQKGNFFEEVLVASRRAIDKSKDWFANPESIPDTANYIRNLVVMDGAGLFSVVAYLSAISSGIQAVGQIPEVFHGNPTDFFRHTGEAFIAALAAKGSMSVARGQAEQTLGLKRKLFGPSGQDLLNEIKNKYKD